MKSLNETTQLVRDEHKKLRGLFRQLGAQITLASDGHPGDR